MLIEVNKVEIKDKFGKIVAYDIEKCDGVNHTDTKGLIVGILTSVDNSKLNNIPYIIHVENYEIEKDNPGLIKAIGLLDKNLVIIQVNMSIGNSDYGLSFLFQIAQMGYRICTKWDIDYDTKFYEVFMCAQIIRSNLSNVYLNLFDDSIKLLDGIDKPEDFKKVTTENIFKPDWISGDYIGIKEKIQLNIIDKFSRLNLIDFLSIEMDDLDVIAATLARDALMTLQLFNIVNSRVSPGTNPVTSVEQAVERIGTHNIKDLVSLFHIRSYSNTTEEIEQLAFFRALFCSALVDVSKKEDLSINKNYAYLIGLFSGIGSLSGTSLEYEIDHIKLDRTLSDALIYREGDGGILYNLVKAYEDDDVGRAKRYSKLLEIPFKQVEKCYYNSIKIAHYTWGRVFRNA